MYGSFEEAAMHIEGVECWSARDLQVLLGYGEWRNFTNVIEKAKDSCKNAGNQIADHFVDVNKIINLAKGAERQVVDMRLTRYACYLVAQNGDAKKEQIAFAQSSLIIEKTQI